ncbi:MAG TPA: citrate/2-methylcitrate synthase [Candidatus Dojkabacteria bacterium]|nr:citrate/2-methylcitrate synthase [Candidatus Dojkabacteria bacterium]HRP50942.1 citrate/2-methylcitrate synthase [Candidatus Dojkabacteria bacterium]
MQELFTKNTKVIFYNEHPVPIQAMLDYDWICAKSEPCVSAIVNPKKSGFHKTFFGPKEILIPVFKILEEAVRYDSKADVLINFASVRSSFESTKVALETPNIRTVILVAEGIPENQTRELIRLAKENKKWIIGPSTVGAIKAGAIRVGYSGGSSENIIESKLYQPGSVGVVTVSGGMSNEVYSIVNNNTDGVNEGVAIGGDTYPGSTLLENVMRLHDNPEIKMLVVLGEIGGTDEYEIADAIKSGKINKPVVAWVSGTVAELFPTEVQFGHAGARSGSRKVSAVAKNKALKEAGAFVPKSFNQFGYLIKKVFDDEVRKKKDYILPTQVTPQIPALDFDSAIRDGLVRRSTSIISGISDDRGEKLSYNGVDIDKIVDKPLSFTINALWFENRLDKTGMDFLELCLKLTADHGPAVVTAHNAITTARAGKDLVSSVVSGLLTIGPRHGGAINDAAKWQFECITNQIDSADFVKEMNSKGELIMGIGHRIKSIQNPDERVQLIKKFAKKNLKQTEHLEFALEVENETTKKKNNLILNVDGAIGAVFLDILKSNKYEDEEILELIEMELFNAIFLLGRTIGIIGHVLDQKRMKEPLYRHPWDDILYK